MGRNLDASRSTVGVVVVQAFSGKALIRPDPGSCLNRVYERFDIRLCISGFMYIRLIEGAR